MGRPRVPAQSAGTGVPYRLLLWGLLAAGLAIRLALTATTRGNVGDLNSLKLVAHLLVSSPAHLYAIANPRGQVWMHWPYPPGYFPVLLAVKAVAGLTGLGIERLVRVPSALADIAIAWVVQDFLGARGAGERTRLAAAALVALGPSFVAISGVHGQIDPVAILPAVIAVSVWERDQSSRRAWLAGLLIGIGAAIKIVPGIMLFALLPTVRSRREAAVLIGATLVAPIISILPMIALDGTHWLSALFSYHGSSGLGGVSLLAQPDLPLNYFGLGSDPPSSLTLFFLAHGGLVADAEILVAAVFVYLMRLRSTTAAVVLWLTFYALGVNFFMQYMVWGLPFFIMAGYLWPTFLLQLLLLGPVIVTYGHTTHRLVAVLFYIVPMIAAWLAEAVALGALVASTVRAARRRSVLAPGASAAAGPYPEPARRA